MRTLFSKPGVVIAVALACPQAAFAKGDLRLEAQVGWDRIADSKVYNQVFPHKLDASGVVYGANVGYDVPVAPLVSVGLDAALSGTTANLAALYADRLQVGRDIYAGARITFHALPGLRVYAKAGYANARFTTNPGLYLNQYAKTAVDPDTVRSNGGLRVGAGLQASVIGPVYLLAEYRYTRYSQQNARNQVITGVGLRF